MIATLRKVWSLFAPSERRKGLVMVGLVILMALAETAGVVSILPFLSVLGRPEVVQENAALRAAFQATGVSDTRSFIVLLGLFSIAVVVLSSAFKTVALHLVNRFVHFQRHSISSRLLERYLHQPYEFFLERNPSELGKNVLSEVDQLIFDLIQPLSMLIAQGAVVFAMTALIVAFDPLMALIMISTVGSLYTVIYALVRRRLYVIGRARQAANAGRFKACTEAFSGIKEVKVTNTADVWAETFSRHSREFSRHAATAETLSTSPLYMVEAVGYCGLITIALALLVQSNDMAHILSGLGLYGFAAYRLLPAAQIMYRGFARLRFSSAALDHVHSDLGLKVERPTLESTDKGSLQVAKEVRLEGVRYAYPSHPGRYVLDDLTLTIPARQCVGIVGASGAGKSTLIDVLLGLLSPEVGQLSVDDLPIHGANLRLWQKSVGYVPQHVYIADSTIAENIAFGAPAGTIDMRAVQHAARVAQIDQVIEQLPQGYSTLVGDRGVRLSGGQRQRLGIARALYHDPDTLILDEATSALDVETERLITEAIDKLAGAKTVILVTHRESLLSACSHVYRLEQGKIFSVSQPEI